MGAPDTDAVKVYCGPAAICAAVHSLFPPSLLVSCVSCRVGRSESSDDRHLRSILFDCASILAMATIVRTLRWPRSKYPSHSLVVAVISLPDNPIPLCPTLAYDSELLVITSLHVCVITHH